MSTLPICQVPGNSDIAGIGIRVAVYMQAALVVVHSFLVENGEGVRRRGRKKGKLSTGSNRRSKPRTRLSNNTAITRAFDQFSHLMNPSISEDVDKDLEHSLFIVGWALVVSALIEAYSNKGSSTGLSDYHALIVLNLSFINFWAGFNLLRRRLEYTGFSIPFRSRRTKAKNTMRTWVPFYIHATMFSVLGILFWTNQSSFLRYTKTQNCQPSVVYWAFRPISLTSRPLKLISLVFYSLFAIPILNGVVTQAISLLTALVLTCAVTIVAVPLILTLISAYLLLIYFISLFASSSADNPGHDFMTLALGRVNQLNNRFRAIHMRMTTVVYTGPIVYWIIATEMLVRRNAVHVGVNVERQMNYGQLMALLTAIMAVTFYAIQIRTRMILFKRQKSLRQVKAQMPKETGTTSGTPPPFPIPTFVMPQRTVSILIKDAVINKPLANA